MRKNLAQLKAFYLIDEANRDQDSSLLQKNMKIFRSSIEIGKLLSFEFYNASMLNHICWEGATKHQLANLVLPFCEAAIAKAHENNSESTEARYRDSRGIVYAIHGQYANAIKDFEAFIAGAYPGQEITKQRRVWIEALNECKSNAINCKNPFLNYEYLRTIE